jgi:hypothetical protein
MDRNVIGLLAALACMFAGCGKTDLHMDLIPGDAAIIVQESDRTIRMEGREGETRHRHSAKYRLDVREVDRNGVAAILVTIEDMTTRLDAPESWGHGDYPQEAVAILARGLSFGFNLAPDGAVTELTGAEQVVDAIVNSLQRPGLEPQAARRIVEQQFSEPALKELFQNLFAHYPQRPVREGARWHGSQVHSTGMPFRADCSYTLTRLSEDVATIEYTARIKPYHTQATVALGYSVAGSEQGAFVVQRSKGWTLSGEATYSLTSRTSGKASTVTGTETVRVTSAGIPAAR